MKIIRVFPRRTAATPDDADVRIATGPGLFDTDIDRVEISVAFTWDIPLVKKLVVAWQHVAPVKVGGPAIGTYGEEFVPGRYLKRGYVITSRGCPHSCWYCPVWKRDGRTRELPITDGWIVQDDNLLSCSEKHIRSVFAMLKRQPKPAEFTGGLDATLFRKWHADELWKLKPRSVFFAYDNPSRGEALRNAGRLLLAAGFPKASHSVQCYVLVGFNGDTIEKEEKRFLFAADAGFMPYAMLYRGDDGQAPTEWKKAARLWSRPAIIARLLAGRRILNSEYAETEEIDPACPVD